MNIAAIWKLPVIFFCESNRYAELSPYDVHVSVPNVSVRAHNYGFRGLTVDGSNVAEIYKAVSTAAADVRGGNGPVFIEAKTHRWHGHYEGDPMTYLRPADRDTEIRVDPIMQFEKFMAERLKIGDETISASKQTAAGDY